MKQLSQMKKKLYMKPSMTVYEMTATPELFAGSPLGGDGEGGYIPGMNLDQDQNHLA